MSTNVNDPFDEFEFKPLTEGLGFHKKSASNNNTNSTALSPTSKVEFRNPNLNFDAQATNSQLTLGTVSPSVSQSVTSASTFNLQSPLPRPQENQKPAKLNIPTIEDDSITKAQSAVNEILKTLNQKKQQEESLQKNKKKIVWTAATPSLSAGFLDGMLITAFYLLCLIAMLAITKIDLIANLTNPDPEFLVYWAALSLLAGIHLIYFVSCRAYLGFTPGEWAFDQRCGSELQLASSSYVLRVALRSIVNMITGFVILPFIALIANKDLAGLVSGVQIQKQSRI